MDENLKSYEDQHSVSPILCEELQSEGQSSAHLCEISLDGKSVDVSLKRAVALDSWSLEKGQAKGVRPEIKALNANLDQVRAEVTNTYNQLKFEGKALNADAIWNKFCGIEPDEHSLMGLIEYHNEHLKEFLEWVVR